MLDRLRHARISYKLAAIFGVAVLGLVVAGWLRVAEIRPRELGARQDRTQQLVEAARSVVAGFYAREHAGTLTRAEAQSAAKDALRGMSYAGEGYFWINDMKPVMIMHPKDPSLNGKDLSGNTDPTGKHLFVDMVDVVRAKGAGFVPYRWPKPNSTTPVPKLSYVAGFAPWGWIVGTGIYIDDVDAAVHSETVKVLLQYGAILLVLALLLVLANRSISRSVRRLSDGMERLADGDVEADAEGGLVETAGSFHRLSVYLRESAAVATRIGDGDLTVEPVPRSERDTLGQALVAMVSNLRSLLRDVTGAAGAVNGAAGEMAGTSQEAGRATEEIAHAVGDVASGAERQVQMVDEAKSAANATVAAASEAQRLSSEGIQRAAEVSALMGDVRTSSEEIEHAIGSLAAKSDAIGGIVETITAIAGQTNLLALNAAIEAARAGEQGRGFAVVAEEVRKLAEESQQAAASIEGLVAEIEQETARTVSVIQDGVRRSTDGAGAVESAQRAFEEIAASVESVTAQSTRIADAMNEVAAVAEEWSASAEQVSASTQQTSASTQEIAASAQSLATTAESLHGFVSRFRLDDGSPATA